MENKYIPKESKFRYAVDSTINIAKKLYKPTIDIRSKCFGGGKKCCSLPYTFVKKSLEISFALFYFFIALIKNFIFGNKHEKRINDINHLKDT